MFYRLIAIFFHSHILPSELHKTVFRKNKKSGANNAPDYAILKDFNRI